MKRLRVALMTVAAIFAIFAVTVSTLGAQSSVKSGTVVTDTFWSQSLGIKKAVVLYLPPSYLKSPTRRYSVAYYLHGLWGSETDWTKQGTLAQTMDSLVAAGGPEMIVVMPDGDDSWYTTWNTLLDVSVCRRNPPQTHESVDTYCVPWPHYDDYIARDLVQFTDKKYRTQAERAHRAIAGLSMGGYGAMSLALGYPEVFSAAASHSGVISPLFEGPKPFKGENPVWAPDGASLKNGWGRFWSSIGPAFGKDTTAWWSRDPGRRLEKLVAKHGVAAVPALFVDCGTEDGLIDESRVFRWVAEKNGVAVTYHEWPGEHNWAYWRAHVPESLSWIGARIAR
jgi:putative tributyrin esterase